MLEGFLSILSFAIGNERAWGEREIFSVEHGFACSLWFSPFCVVLLCLFYFRSLRARREEKAPHRRLAVCVGVVVSVRFLLLFGFAYRFRVSGVTRNVVFAVFLLIDFI